MIIVTTPEATENQIAHIVERIEEWGFKTDISRGAMRTVIGVIGDDAAIRVKPLAAIPGVESVTPVLKPYKLVSREFRGGNHSHVKIGDVTVGEKDIVLMSGPCSVESRDQIVEIAREVQKSGGRILRGGAFQAAHFPYAFQGLGLEGLQTLAEARAAGLPACP